MKRSIKAIIICLIILLYSTIYNNYVVNNIPGLSNMLNNGFILFITCLSYFFFGFQKNKSNRVEANIALYIIVFSLIYLISLFVLGIYTGFRRSFTVCDIKVVFCNVVNIILFYGTLEILRYIFTKSNRDNKVLLILFNLSISVLEIVVTLGNIYYYDNSSITNLILTIILPIYMKHFVLSYISYNFNYKYCLIYSLSNVLWLYVSPVIPLFSNYLWFFIRVFIPLFMYMFLKKSLHIYNHRENVLLKKRINNYINLSLVITFFIIVLIISGVTPYSFLAIATESMTPTIQKGDAVFIKKNVDINELNEKDIIAYDDGEKIIVHRILKIEDGKIITKGDYNVTEDNIEINSDNLVGKYIFKIPVVAKPAIWIKEKIGR